MRYIKFYLSIGFCGCDDERYVAFKDDITDSEIDKYGIELAEDHADSYRDYEHFGLMGCREDYYSDEEYEEAYEEAEYSFNEWIKSSWEEIDEEEWKDNDGMEA